MRGLRALGWKPHLRITSISAKLVTSAATQITRRPACPIPSRVAASRDAPPLRAPQPSLSGEPLGNDGGLSHSEARGGERVGGPRDAHPRLKSALGSVDQFPFIVARGSKGQLLQIGGA